MVVPTFLRGRGIEREPRESTLFSSSVRDVRTAPGLQVARPWRSAMVGAPQIAGRTDDARNADVDSHRDRHGGVVAIRADMQLCG